MPKVKSSDHALTLRSLPAVGRCLDHALGLELQHRFGKGATSLVLQEIINDLRDAIQRGEHVAPCSPESILHGALPRLRRLFSPEGRTVINGTGILLHTGLGRSPLSRSALEALSPCRGYSLVEVDLESGERNHRESRAAELLRHLTGCESATVVNNNAAATFLMLRGIARGKEVIISRGQLIEIGGSFRMPDVMEESGCILREVGTTNRTHLADYENAITENTGALLHVHTSNYRVRGFTGTPSIEELVELGRRTNLPVLDDLGSGALVPLSPFGLPDEGLVQDSLRAGASVVAFSGDKLISGPQCGILCGTTDVISRLRRDPFYRMFRPDKLTIAALEATLAHFVNGDEYRREIPLYQMLARTEEKMREMAETISRSLAAIPQLRFAIEPSSAFTGGGALPDTAIPSIALVLSPSKSEQSPGGSWATRTARHLRLEIPSIFTRIEDDSVKIEMRSLLDGDEIRLAEILPAVLQRLLTGVLLTGASAQPQRRQRP